MCVVTYPFHVDSLRMLPLSRSILVWPSALIRREWFVIEAVCSSISFPTKAVIQMQAQCERRQVSTDGALCGFSRKLSMLPYAHAGGTLREGGVTLWRVQITWHCFLSRRPIFGARLWVKRHYSAQCFHNRYDTDILNIIRICCQTLVSEA